MTCWCMADWNTVMVLSALRRSAHAGVVGVAHEVFGVLEAALPSATPMRVLGTEDVAVELGALGEVGLQVFGETDRLRWRRRCR